jgi:hypothetical protein
LILDSWLSSQVCSSNWTFWLSAQDFRQAVATGHSIILTRAHEQLDTPAALDLRALNIFVHTSSISKWTLQESSQQELGTDSGYPHQSSQAPPHPLHGFILDPWLSAQVPPSNWTLRLPAQDLHRATGHSRYPHKSSQALDKQVILAEPMVPGHMTLDGSICTSVSSQWI